jgi:hypothetical protein
MIPPVRSSTASFPLDHATHPRRAQRHSVVDYVRFGTCDDDGTPAVLCVNVPGLNRSTMPWRALDVARSGSEDGSV